MYRLLRARAVPLSQPGVPRTCLFCNFCHYREPPKLIDRLQLRHHSTTINSVTLTTAGKKKIKRRTSKKYAELLEVTDLATSNRKAAVRHLNAAQLSILVDQPDITLDKLHKIKSTHLRNKNRDDCASLFANAGSESSNMEFSKFPTAFTTRTLQDAERNQLLSTLEEQDKGEERLVEDVEVSGIVDGTLTIQTSALANSLRKSSEEPNSKEVTVEKSKRPDHPVKSKERIIDKEQEATEALVHKEKLRQFNDILLGYVNVCVNTSSQDCLTKLFRSYQRSNKKKLHQLCINSIAVYNAKIEHLASDSDFKSITEMLQGLRANDMIPNHQTYAYIFYCIGCMKNEDEEKLALLKGIHKDMIGDGISLNDVITKSVFVRDQRAFVQKMVKLLDDQFVPIYKLPDTRYDCRLLQRLSEETATPASPIEGLMTLSEIEDRLKKQMAVEIDGQVTVRNISIQNASMKNFTHWRNKISNLEKSWEKVALKSFKRNLVMLKSREAFSKGSRMMLHPYLNILRPEDYVRIIMREIQNIAMGSEMYSLPLNALSRQVGIQVYRLYEAKIKQSSGVNDKTSEVYLQYCDWLVNRNDGLNTRQKWKFLEHEANKHGVTLSADVPSWQGNIHIAIGKFLYNIIVSDLRLDVSFAKKKKSHGHGHCIPAFFKIFRHSGVMLKEEVKPHPLLAKLYRDSQPETLTFDTTLVPSLCPPRPWVSVHSGGYIVTKTDIVRVSHMGNQQWERLAKTPPRKLFPALDSLNQLSSIPWTVNSSVLDVAIKVFQDDGSVELNMPQPPSVLEAIPPAPKDADREEKRFINKARMELKRKKGEMYSLWCDALYRLSLANHFRNEIFWLPHNMDFRGRVYPIPPHLNHLGSDLARSVLVFALKKPLGPGGLDWLKLHVINLTGFKKREPVSERLKYADEIMDKILDSAEKPLTGEMWWATSDEPWQTLAACMEISAALKSPDPEQYMSGFPIHQDGSCNGLQHYAALGRDQIGAESVNLYPSAMPQDVYSDVVSMVDERRKEDANNGDPAAKILEGFIKRKVIKQTVMTTVYGVTWFGAKLQIARQLKDADDFPQEHLWPASTYLVTKTFECLRTMFKSAREIQDWLTDCARLVCMTREQNMEWVTPLGLPVVQPYSKLVRYSSKASTPFFSPDIFRKPHVMKQKNAFAPNYVHSLDSSHMMLTSIHSEHAGITFVSVHDCYWTHPCTVEIMNKLCREQFVALHSEPILGDLSRFLIEKFGYDELDTDNEKQNKKQTKAFAMERLNATLRKVPKQGDFDLKGVLSSTYFFS